MRAGRKCCLKGLYSVLFVFAGLLTGCAQTQKIGNHNEARQGYILSSAFWMNRKSKTKLDETPFLILKIDEQDVRKTFNFFTYEDRYAVEAGAHIVTMVCQRKLYDYSMDVNHNHAYFITSVDYSNNKAPNGSCSSETGMCPVTIQGVKKFDCSGMASFELPLDKLNELKDMGIEYLVRNYNWGQRFTDKEARRPQFVLLSEK